MDPPRLRMLSGVHEAGHAIAAATMGFTVTQMRVSDPAMIGSGEDGTEVSLGRYSGKPVPLPDLLTMKAAGYQASFIWLQGRGIDGDTPPYDRALNTLAGHDISWCLDICRQFRRPDLTMQDGIEGAWHILTSRWPAVLRLAYVLAARGAMTGGDLQPYVAAGPEGCAAAISSYRAWRTRTSDLWRRQPGKPGEVRLDDPAGESGTRPGGSAAGPRCWREPAGGHES
jgi:hypothetical protein